MADTTTTTTTDTKVTKGGVKPLPIDFYSLSTSDLIKHLHDLLGFRLAGWYFGRWESADQKKGYIWMNIALFPDDIVAKKEHRDYVDRVLDANASNIKFKDTAYNTLRPFMFPPSFSNVYNDPEKLRDLEDMGIYGPRLETLVRNIKLDYCVETGLFSVYLMPERIITDILRSPKTNKVDGDLSIVRVNGTTMETISWDVIVSKGNARLGSNSNLLLNSIYNNK